MLTRVRGESFYNVFLGAWPSHYTRVTRLSEPPWSPRCRAHSPLWRVPRQQPGSEAALSTLSSWGRVNNHHSIPEPRSITLMRTKLIRLMIRLGPRPELYPLPSLQGAARASCSSPASPTASNVSRGLRKYSRCRSTSGIRRFRLCCRSCWSCIFRARPFRLRL